MKALELVLAGSLALSSSCAARQQYQPLRLGRPEVENCIVQEVRVPAMDYDMITEQVTAQVHALCPSDYVVAFTTADHIEGVNNGDTYQFRVRPELDSLGNIWGYAAEFLGRK